MSGTRGPTSLVDAIVLIGVLAFVRVFVGVWVWITGREAR